jgi:tRNA 2-thiouridine synthesizing protein A
MKTVRIETKGMRCPQPVLMLAHRSREVERGALLEIAGDCPTFEADVRTWCARQGKTILAVLGAKPELVIQIVA